MEYKHKVYDKVYHWIITKKKDVEVRTLEGKDEKIQVGDYITFYNLDYEEKFVKVKVIAKDIFSNVEEILKKYDISHIMPGHSPNDIKETMIKIYGKEVIEKKLVAFKIEYISSDNDNNINH